MIRRAAVHIFGFLTDGDNFLLFERNRHDGRLIEDDLASLADQHIDRAEVNAKFF